MSQISVRLAANVARQVAKATPQVCHLQNPPNVAQPAIWKKVSEIAM